MPWWAAVLLALVLSAAGAILDKDRLTDDDRLTSLGLYQVLFLAGCVVAVLAVRRRNLFGPMVQPPLIFAVTFIPVQLTARTSTETGMKKLIFEVGLPLASSFPWMAGATAGTILLGVLRLLIQRDPNGRAGRLDAAGEDRPRRERSREDDDPPRRPARDDRAQRSSRDDQRSRDERRGRDERGPRDERSSRDERNSRGERGSAGERGARGERGSAGDRGSRGERGQRDERGPRDDRAQRRDQSPPPRRPARDDQDDRPQRSGREGRDDRGDRGNRGEAQPRRNPPRPREQGGRPRGSSPQRRRPREDDYRD
ncbi:hypothetical protein EV192_105613 [Actinocrispum wychmicini]|uniref:DUF6542 domain-containing protein n=1 Tax=Actinocrispum wychmicini TaxID=1213861 RepID=A0A4R2JFL9_9PSEU|nr:hypothetical protein EV192_105613 [Actinocrispum wychmicini]